MTRIETLAWCAIVTGILMLVFHCFFSALVKKYFYHKRQSQLQLLRDIEQGDKDNG